MMLSTSAAASETSTSSVPSSSSSNKHHQDVQHSRMPPIPSHRTLLPAAATTTAHRPTNNTSTTPQSTSLLTSSTTTVEANPSSSSSCTSSIASSSSTPAAAAATSRRISITHCPDAQQCVSLADRIEAINLTVSVDQAWALIHQTTLMYHTVLQSTPHIGLAEVPLVVPNTTHDLCLHSDGSVHIAAAVAAAAADTSHARTQRMILYHLGYVVCHALSAPGRVMEMTDELEEMLAMMMLEDTDAETTAVDASDAADDEREDATGKRTLDNVLAMCASRVDGVAADSGRGRAHYRAVCRAFATESLELRAFLQQMCKKSDDSSSTITTNTASTAISQLDTDHLGDAAHRELQSFGLSEWTHYWQQVVEELRCGVRLKKHNATRPALVFELTPYEILMEDIRSRNYDLRKVMVNGEVPVEARVVKHDAHAIILEFIRSRPPLRKVMDRKLAPLIVKPTLHDMLMGEIRGGPSLRPVQSPPEKPIASDQPSQRMISVDLSLFGDDDDDARETDAKDDRTTDDQKLHCKRTAQQIALAEAAAPAAATLLDEIRGGHSLRPIPAAAMARRKISVDMSLFGDDDDEETKAGRINGDSKLHHKRADHSPHQQASIAAASSAVDSAQVVHRRKTINNNVANNHNNNQQHSTHTKDDHRTSKRRHTIVGCQSNGDLTAGETPSPPPVTINPLNPLNAMTQQALAEWTAMPLTDDDDNDDDDDDDMAGHVSHSTANNTLHLRHQSSAGGDPEDNDMDMDIPHATPAELPEHTGDRLTLSLEEIVHIRSVMTKAELEGLPVGVQVKEEVERRKVCFLCLRTRFGLFRQWGVQCKLCQRTVCTKCHTKMRIPTEHFRNVPVMLLSASLMGSPVTAAAPQRITQLGGGASILDDSYQRAMLERSLRAEVYGGDSLSRQQHTAGSAPATPRIYHRNGPAGASLGHHHHMSSSMAAEPASTNGSSTTGVRAGAPSALARHHRQHDMALMSRSMDAAALSASVGESGPRSLPQQSPRSHPNTLDRQTRFARAFNRSQANTVNHVDSCHRDVLRGELSSVCNDCRDLVNNICRSSKQTRSSARNRTLRSLTLDLSPVYK